MKKTFKCKYGTVIAAKPLDEAALMEGCRRALAIDARAKRLKEQGGGDEENAA